MSEVETLLAEVKAEIKTVGDEVKNVAEDALKKASNAQSMTDTLRQKADEALSKQGELQTQLKELENRQVEIDQKISSRTDNGQPEFKSLGDAVVNSDAYKAFVDNGYSGRARYTLENAITSATPGGGGLIWSDREDEIVRLPRRNFTIRDLLTVGSTGTNAVDYAKQTVRTNNAATVAEAAQKPESAYAWEQATTAVRTIAHWVPVTRQAMEDSAQLRTEIDSELRYGLDREEEDQILSGDGVGQNLSGLITNATAYSAEFAVASEKEVDKVMLGILQASLADYPADGIVMHPTDFARVVLSKDGDANYIAGGPQMVMTQTLWGLPVVQTRSIEADKFLIGSFKLAATIYDRMATEVLISSEDQDNFIKNMYTVRAEKRLALAVKRPTALVYGDFGNVA